MRIFIQNAFLILFLVVFTSVAQSENLTRAQYIDKYKELAIRNMIEFNIPASVTLAQACLESGNGNSELAKRSNNHFGIKCHSDWKGRRTYHDDDKKGECFRVYDEVYESYADHSRFLQRPRYAKCFELKITDYKAWAHELKNAGYATNPKYPQLLIKIIEESKLYEIDEEALKRKKGGDKHLAKNTKPQKTKSKNNDFEQVDLFGNAINIQKTKNNIKYIEAKPNENPESIARRLELGLWQIKSYNNIGKDYRFSEGERVYIQPKRRKASEEFHKVVEGETMWQISQKHGVKLNTLYRNNRMKKGEEPKVGEILHLQKRKPKN